MFQFHNLFYLFFLRHNNGHITRVQFRQGLTMLDIPISQPEMAALEARFFNDVGVNYLAFLKALEPEDPPQFMYVKRLEEVRQANAKGALPELHAETGLEKILIKIKTKVRSCWYLSPVRGWLSYCAPSRGSTKHHVHSPSAWSLISSSF